MVLFIENLHFATRTALVVLPSPHHQVICHPDRLHVVVGLDALVLDCSTLHVG